VGGGVRTVRVRGLRRRLKALRRKLSRFRVRLKDVRFE
jgi:hypothetical protein